MGVTPDCGAGIPACTSRRCRLESLHHNFNPKARYPPQRSATPIATVPNSHLSCDPSRRGCLILPSWSAPAHAEPILFAEVWFEAGPWGPRLRPAEPAPMRRPRRNRRSSLPCYANAALLRRSCCPLSARGPGWSSIALTARPQHASDRGRRGLFLMPAQFAVITWGCYLMDIDGQTLVRLPVRRGRRSCGLSPPGTSGRTGS